MDIYSYLPYIFLVIAGSIALFFIWNWLRVKKLAATDEGVCMQSCRIELDVGTHIVPFEGTLYHFNKLLNPKHFHRFGKSIGKDEAKLKEYKKFLEANGHFYAMRQGMKLFAFISLHNPIEIAPFFKSEEGSAKKVVHAVGSIGKKTEGIQHVVMEPINLKKYTLNPGAYDQLDAAGGLLTTLFEKVPLIAEIDAEKEKNRIMQSKVDSMSAEIGRQKDQIEYWKHLARKKGAEETKEAGGRFAVNMSWLPKILPYIFLFAVGYLISPMIPQLVDQPPFYLGGALSVIGFIVKKVVWK